ncbi:MAG: hypothetical protein M3069_04925, partial [Chloroflexota bacterium]|nr:hypothetical protein [Chloroflexota bacterium]
MSSRRVFSLSRGLRPTPQGYSPWTSRQYPHTTLPTTARAGAHRAAGTLGRFRGPALARVGAAGTLGDSEVQAGPGGVSALK